MKKTWKASGYALRNPHDDIGILINAMIHLEGNDNIVIHRVDTGDAPDFEITTTEEGWNNTVNEVKRETKSTHLATMEDAHRAKLLLELGGII